MVAPVDKRSLKAIMADDAKPYEWLSTSLTSVMPATYKCQKLLMKSLILIPLIFYVLRTIQSS